MKKVIVILAILCLCLSTAVMADGVRNTTLGAPILLVDDTAVLANYPGALQLFPSSVWLRFSGGGTYYAGVAYKANDMMAVAANYTINPAGVYVIPYPAPASPGLAAVQNLLPLNVASQQHIAILGYGVKLGTLLAGVSMQNEFPVGTIVQQTMDSNSKILSGTNISGIRMVLKPSAVMDMGNLKLYGSLGLTMNMMKFYAFDRQKTNSVTVSPSFLENGTLAVLGVFKLSDDAMAGAQVFFSYSDDGAMLNALTNTSVSAKTNWFDNTMAFGVTLGYRTKAGEKALLFFDVPFMMSIQSGAHWKDDLANSYNKVTMVQLPTIKVGGEFEIFKGLKFRVSAGPTWTQTTTEPASYKQLAAGTKRVVDAYGLASALGLGYRGGPWSINGVLSAAWLNQVITDPILTASGIFTGVANPIIGTIQVNYLF